MPRALRGQRGRVEFPRHDGDTEGDDHGQADEKSDSDNDGDHRMTHRQMRAGNNERKWQIM